MVVLGNMGTVRARHSERAVVANQNVFVPGGGSPGTASPTGGWAKVKFNCHTIAYHQKFHACRQTIHAPSSKFVMACAIIASPRRFLRRTSH